MSGLGLGSVTLKRLPKVQDEPNQPARNHMRVTLQHLYESTMSSDRPKVWSGVEQTEHTPSNTK